MQHVDYQGEFSITSPGYSPRWQERRHSKNHQHVLNLSSVLTTQPARQPGVCIYRSPCHNPFILDLALPCQLPKALISMYTEERSAEARYIFIVEDYQLWHMQRMSAACPNRVSHIHAQKLSKHIYYKPLFSSQWIPRHVWPSRWH